MIHRIGRKAGQSAPVSERVGLAEHRLDVAFLTVPIMIPAHAPGHSMVLRGT
jgi:hypothetical protein